MQPPQFLANNRNWHPEDQLGALTHHDPDEERVPLPEALQTPQSKNFFTTQSTSPSSFILACNTAPAVLNLGKQYFSNTTEPNHLKRFSNLVISPQPGYTAQFKHNPLHFKGFSSRINSGGKK